MSEPRPAGTTLAGHATAAAISSGSVNADGEEKSLASAHPRPRERTPAPDTESERYREMLGALEGCAVFVIAVDGHVQTWPESATHLFGYTPAEIAGRHFSCLFTPADIESGVPQRWLDAARQSGSAQDDGWRVRSDGSQLWAACGMTAMADASGAVSGFVVASRDITVQLAAEEHARLADERMRLLAETVPGVAACELSPDGEIRSWNAGAQEITGYPPEEAIGRPLSMLYTRQDVASGHDRAGLEAARASGQWEGGERLERKDGSLVRCQTRIALIRDAAGCPAGMLWTARDVSDALRLEELESGNRRVQSFLAILAHELRNPLAPIRNAVDVIALTPSVDVRIQRCAEIIDRQFHQLERLVDDLLDVGRVTAGKLKVELTPTAYNDVVTASIESIRPVLESAGQQLVVSLPPESPHVSADAARLGQVLINLLSNATKYTPRGGTVAVHVVVEDGSVVTTVSDTGQGMEPAALDRIFNLFSQEGEGVSRGGLGIGLALARAVVEAHGGAIQADSQGPGKGSTFTVILPQVAACGEPAGHIDADTGRKRRVLILDDNPDSADSMAELLNLLGHDARPAYTGSQALALAAEFQPDCALLDLEMPDMSGFEVLDALQAMPAGQSMQFFALTGRGTAEDVRRSQEAGFHIHLVKPLSIEALRRALSMPAGQSVQGGARQPER